MIMEWIQHGTLLNFVNKATSKLRDGERLPNRLLWRFFLCRKLLVALIHVNTILS